MYDPATALRGTPAVLGAMPENPAVIALAALATDAKFDRGELTVTVAGGQIVAACEAVKAAGYTFFEDLTAVDWYPQEPRFQLSYHILSQRLKSRIRLVVQLDSSSLSVPSITSAWPAANFYEREVFDLFGIDFPGHPRLTRIMMPTDWQGHPLRKDYPVEGYR
jgi:NADH-quinone oxidoreductase subunit C